MAKTALVGMVRALANELDPHSIRVNSVHPTTVDTPMVTNEVILWPASDDARYVIGVNLPVDGGAADK